MNEKLDKYRWINERRIACLFGYRRLTIRLVQVVQRSPDTDIHVIMDNLSTHSGDDIDKGLKKHPRVTLHYAPTGSYWLNKIVTFGISPAGIQKAGRAQLAAIATAHTPRIGEMLVAEIWAALGEQTVTVPGTTAADLVLPRLAESLKTALQQRTQVAGEVEEGSISTLLPRS